MKKKPCLLIFGGVDHEGNVGTAGFLASVQSKESDHFGDGPLKEPAIIKVFSRLSQDVKDVSLSEAFFEIVYPDADGRPWASETWRFVRKDYEDNVRQVILQDGRALICTDLSAVKYGNASPLLELTT